MNSVFSQQDDITDDALNLLTQKAMRGDKEALASLVEHPEVREFLDIVSAWAGRRYHQDTEEVKQDILIILHEKIKMLNNPRLLQAWCYNIARNYCLNKIRQGVAEKTCLDKIYRQRQEGKKHNGHDLIQSTPVLTPEEELLIKERKSLIKEAMRKAAGPFPKEILDMWAMGKRPREIAEETGKSLKTVYRILKGFQKAILKEIQPKI